jgi:hypothetical protein
LRLSLSIRVLAAILFASRLHAGFASTETFLPAVGRVAGQGGAQFYTTVWATNLTSEPQTMTFRFLKQGQANGSPASFVDTLQPDETKVYENVVESKLGLSNAIGAARVTSTGEIFVSERIFNQAPGADLGDTEGLFFAGVPKSFSISAGQSASIQGVDQGGAEDFRYNFALVETGGGSPTVNVQVLDGNGTLLGQKSYPMAPYEQLQPAVSDVVAGIHTTNARITATVTGGTGSVLIAGAQLANVSQDSSGFEMTFRNELLGGGSSTGGLSSVIHDASLLGSGTSASPLGVNPSAVVTSLNGFHGAVTLAAGSNISITPAGSTLTITSTGSGGGGLTLPFSGNTSLGNGAGFGIKNTGAGIGISSESTGGNALVGMSGSGTAILGESSSGTGVYGQGYGATAAGVYGTNPIGDGVEGAVNNDDHAGVRGTNDGGGEGVVGKSANGYGVHGISNAGLGLYSAGVVGEDSAGVGVFGSTDSGTGVYGYSNGGNGVRGITFNTGINHAGVLGVFNNGSGMSGHAGIWGDSNQTTGVLGTTNSTAAGVLGISTVGTGVYGQSTSGTAVYFNGGLAGTGTKSFVEPHPTDASKEIRYVCLEGPEAGTYFRGTARIVNGFAIIEVPDHFRMVSSASGLTVQLTPSGDFAALTCVKKSLDRIVVKGSADVEFDYVVNGIRKAFATFQPIAENRDFAPKFAGDDLGIAALPAESVRRLKANGVLNADGTVNLETAHRLGWDRQESWKRAEADKSR